MSMLSHEYIFPHDQLGKKKLVLFPEIGRVKIFLSSTRPQSRVCMRIYIFCFKKHTNKKISPTKFIRTNLHFFPSNNKR